MHFCQILKNDLFLKYFYFLKPIQGLENCKFSYRVVLYRPLHFPAHICIRLNLSLSGICNPVASVSIATLSLNVEAISLDMSP